MTHNEDSIASSQISVSHSTASKEEKEHKKKTSYFSIDGKERIDKFIAKLKKTLNKNLYEIEEVNADLDKMLEEIQ